MPKDISENVENLNELDIAIQKIIQNEKTNIQNKLLHTHIKNSVGNNFSDNIGKTLLKLNKLNYVKDKFSSKFFFYYFKLIQKIKNFVLHFILDVNQKNLIKRKKIKLFNYNNNFVSKVFDDICVIKNIKNLKISELYPGIYIIKDRK